MRSMESRQLSFAFADSPKGSGSTTASDASAAERELLRIAEDMPAEDSITTVKVLVQRQLFET